MHIICYIHFIKMCKNTFIFMFTSFEWCLSYSSPTCPWISPCFASITYNTFTILAYSTSLKKNLGRTKYWLLWTMKKNSYPIFFLTKLFRNLYCNCIASQLSNLKFCIKLHQYLILAMPWKHLKMLLESSLFACSNDLIRTFCWLSFVHSFSILELCL